MPTPCATIQWWMSVTMATLRRLQACDLDQVVEVYRDAVISQGRGLYTNRQIEAWSEHAAHHRGVREALQRGYGMASCADHDGGIIEAFGLLDPIDRLSLLYCRGRSCRQGRASALLQVLENRALHCGCRRLRTEASQLSRPLLERVGWRIEAEEEVIFAGVGFRRWRMIKNLF
jgi:putative acetyltransferase